VLRAIGVSSCAHTHTHTHAHTHKHTHAAIHLQGVPGVNEITAVAEAYVPVMKIKVGRRGGCEYVRASLYVSRVGQNRIYAPYMTVCTVISLLKIPYIPINVWFWPTLLIT